MHWIACILLFIPLLRATNFYLPGVTPSEWDDGEEVLLKVNKITSSDSPIPYDYYDLPFCRRGKKRKGRTENIGESITGDSTTTSPYNVSSEI
jgi:transmembrane 9 superfamily member 2/4